MVTLSYDHLNSGKGFGILSSNFEIP